MMRKIVTMALVVALTAGVAITGTLAYLTDRDSKANVFTVGDVEIVLNEDFEQGETLVPGEKIEKKPTITNTGKNEAWVWATVAIPSAFDDEDASKNVIHFNYSADDVNDQEWTWTDSETEDWLVSEAEINGIKHNVYTVLYQTPLKPDEETSAVIHTVYMDAHIDIDPEGNWYHVENGVVSEKLWNTAESGNPVIYVSAYAIQKEGFATVQEAYAAYKAQWGENGAEYAAASIAAPESGAVRPAGYIPVTAGEVIDSLVVFDQSDEVTNLRALYTKDTNMTGDLAVNNSYLDGTYAMNVTAEESANAVLTADNTAFRGWVSYSGFAGASFTNCTFDENSNPEIYNVIRPYDDTTFINCEFSGTEFWLDKLEDGDWINFKNCTYNGKLIESAGDINVAYGSTVGTVAIIKDVQTTE